MRIAALWLVGIVACGGGGGGAPAPEVPKAKPGDLGVDLANLTSQLPPFVDSIGAGDPVRAFSGYVIVAQHDQVIWRGAYGLADRTRQRVPTADTSFRIGSVTKQFTAAAILKLEQDGKLKVDDKVGSYLPDAPEAVRDLTLHQLLTHTAGVMNYTQDPAILARKAERFTTAQLLALFWSRPLDFTPGSKFSYSNGGYAILGAIIERVSGMSYGDYLATAIFRPAELRRTVVGDAEGDPDRAEGYQIDGGKLVPADRIDMSMPFAAGAIRSTANDLLRWHRALTGDRVLGAAAKAKLYKPALQHYAYGWVEQEVRGHQALWHNGGIDGFGTIYWRVPDADLVVVAWTNVTGVAVDPIGKAAVEAALGGTLTPLKPLEKGALDPAIVARLSGTFELSAEVKAKLAEQQLPKDLIDSITTLAITPSNEGVVIKPNGQGEVELRPLADGTFFDPDHQISLVFDRAGSGPIGSVRLEQGPLKITYQRKP